MIGEVVVRYVVVDVVIVRCVCWIVGITVDIVVGDRVVADVDSVVGVHVVMLCEYVGAGVVVGYVDITVASALCCSPVVLWWVMIWRDVVAVIGFACGCGVAIVYGVDVVEDMGVVVYDGFGVCGGDAVRVVAG